MDDILDKLRVQADVADAFPMLRAKDSAMTNWVREAADEIERLRAENHGLRIRVFTLLKKLEKK